MDGAVLLHEVERAVVGELDDQERAVRSRIRDAQQLGQEPGGALPVTHMDDGVVELDRHDVQVTPSCRRDRPGCRRIAHSLPTHSCEFHQLTVSYRRSLAGIRMAARGAADARAPDRATLMHWADSSLSVCVHRPFLPLGWPSCGDPPNRSTMP